jgi:hypothetical protein
MELILPIGTKVFHIDHGFIEINGYANGFYYFKDKSIKISETSRLLSLTEYSLLSGGLTPISLYWWPKVGDSGYFWNNENDHELLYGQIANILEDYTIYTTSTNRKFKHYSKEVPEWFINKSNSKIK